MAAITLLMLSAELADKVNITDTCWSATAMMQVVQHSTSTLTCSGGPLPSWRGFTRESNSDKTGLDSVLMRDVSSAGCSEVGSVVESVVGAGVEGASNLNSCLMFSL